MAGLYIHIPNLLALDSRSLFTTTTFVQALCTELAFYGETQGQEDSVNAIHLGGYPGSLTPEGLRAIVESIIKGFSVDDLEEFTAELRPGTQAACDLDSWQALGINRLCLPLTFPLGTGTEPSTEDDLLDTVRDARKAGFDQLDVVLQYDPDEAPAEVWKSGLASIVEYGFTHLSLQNEEDAQERSLPDQLARFLSYPATHSDHSTCYLHTIEYLKERGYDQTTLSSFCRPGHESTFESLYIQHMNYLGIGPTAHSFWWNGRTQNAATRWANVHNLAHYNALLKQRQLPLETRSRISQDTLADEYILFHLRTQEGLNIEFLEEYYGLDLLVDRVDVLAQLEGEGYIHPIRKSRIRLTERGMMACPTVTHNLLNPPS